MRACACHEICSAPICMSALKRGSRRVPASVAKMPRVSRNLSRNRIASTKLSACHAICASVCASVSVPAPVQSLLRQNRPSGVVNKVAFSPPEMPNAPRVTLYIPLPHAHACFLPFSDYLFLLFVRKTIFNFVAVARKFILSYRHSLEFNWKCIRCEVLQQGSS